MSVEEAKKDLIDPTELRVGVNMGNILLVTDKTAEGLPIGISADIGAAIAERLGVKLKLIPYKSPGAVADAVDKGEWDIGNIADEPKRAETIDFCQSYVEIPCTYLVTEDSPLKAIEDVDKPGIRVAISERSAYDLYLTRTLKHAELVREEGLANAAKLYFDQKLDALAGLIPALKENVEQNPGHRLLPGQYMAVRQAVGTSPSAKSLNAFVQEFLTEAKSSGYVQERIDKHGVTGKLFVASD